MKLSWNSCAGFLTIGTLILVVATAAAGSSLEDSRRKLAEIERRIAEGAKNLEAKRAAEQSLTVDLQTVEREIATLQSGISELKRRLATLEKNIAANREEAEAARRAVAATEVKVRKRLAALYKSGDTGLARILFSAASPARLAEDYDFLGRIVRRDRELLAAYRRQVEQLQAALAQQTALQREQQSALATLEEEQQVSRRALRLKEELLARARRDRRALASNLEELKERAGRLADLVEKLESEQSREYTEKSGVFANRRGLLPWPVEGRIRIGFGTGLHPDLGTLHNSQGIEIATTGQKPIKAVGAGRVVFANWFKGYGNLLIVDHGESYYSLYAQASRLDKKVGEPVAEGEVLGYSGMTDSQGVYFEIRHGGTPLDPTVWLKPR